MVKISYLPVAQLDSASDSDSEGRRFESFRVGQEKDPTFVGSFSCLCERVRPSWKHHVNSKINRNTGVLPAHALRGLGSESFRVGQKNSGF